MRGRRAWADTRADERAGVIEWNAPDGARANWLRGAGATRAELTIMWAGALVGIGYVAVMYARSDPGDWSWWQYALAAFLAWDLVGGAVSNASNSTKRQYFGAGFAHVGGAARIIRAPIAFTALHLHPFLIVALYPHGTWGWAIGMYVGAVVGAVLVDRVVPQYLQRPAAMLVFCTVMLWSRSWTAPPGWEWFAAIFLAKLILAHAVREEPYRPAPGT
ncbi:unannotated protein [freshwater metagenome]|uniref:Unannotated protein n=1 Tax=freshwater metagenome TaxID=449393 RepID=A0A6J6CY90_9ZZZZ